MEKKKNEELRLRRGFFKITARDVCGDKIKTFFYIMFWGLLICFPYNVQSQNFESYFAPLGDMVTLGAIIENPNLQSQDMQNYIAYVNSGDNCINNAKYADAMDLDHLPDPDHHLFVKRIKQLYIELYKPKNITKFRNTKIFIERKNAS